MKLAGSQMPNPITDPQNYVAWQAARDRVTKAVFAPKPSQPTVPAQGAGMSGLTDPKEFDSFMKSFQDQNGGKPLPPDVLSALKAIHDHFSAGTGGGGTGGGGGGTPAPGGTPDTSTTPPPPPPPAPPAPKPPVTSTAPKPVVTPAPTPEQATGGGLKYDPKTGKYIQVRQPAQTSVSAAEDFIARRRAAGG